MSEIIKKSKSIKENEIRIETKEENNSINENPSEDERDMILNNPEAFRKKRDFFSFYSKQRSSTTKASARPMLNIHNKKANQEIILERQEYKRFSAIELIPRGFGLVKLKERIEFFEKSLLEKEYKINALNEQQKKFYDNNEPRKFDFDSIKVENSKPISFKNINEQNNNKNLNNEFGKNNKDNNMSKNNDNEHNNNNEKNELKKKLNLNLIVDYSKIINSSKINRKKKELDIFLNKKKDNNIFKDNSSNTNNIITINNIQTKQEEDLLSLSFNSYKEEENSTNFSHALNPEKIVKIKPKHRKQNSDICNFNNLISKTTRPEQKESNLPKLGQIVKAFDIDEAISKEKNYKYVFVKKTNDRLSVEKNNKYKSRSVKKILYENISDKMSLDRFDKAKYNLNIENNNKIIKNQIFEIFDKIIMDNNIKTKKQKNIKNKKQKFIKAIEIMPQLLLIKQKVNSLLANNGKNSDNINIDFNLNEIDIKNHISSMYFLDCLGIDRSILFKENEKEIIQNKNFINDIDENIILIAKNNKKRYIKYYFRNLNKANLFLDILIDNINKIQLKENISINK